MSRTPVSAALRRLVCDRAKNCCEYCFIPQWFTAFGCEIDHILPEKHQGSTTEDNLALACGFCNQYKGSDIGSFLPPDLDMIVEPKTAIGAVTANVLRLNAPERVAERRELHRLGLYP